jgi:phospholipid transport system transporter-binding protein
MSGEVCIDLSGITRADSAGLALLIDWLRIARREKVTLRFEKLPEQLTQIAEVCDLHSVLPIEH